MQRKLRHIVQMGFLVMLTYSVASPIQANTNHYITEDLVVALRSGAGTQYRIIQFLKSGTAFKKINKEGIEPKEGWFYISVDDKEGWVETRYVSTTPPARDKVAQLQEELTALQDKHSSTHQLSTQLNQQVSSLEMERNELSRSLQQIQTDYKRLKKISEKAVEMDQENRALQQQLATLSIQLDEIGIENQILKDTKYVDGITHGAIAILLGCFMGIILPRLGGVKKRSNGWD